MFLYCRGNFVAQGRLVLTSVPLYCIDMGPGGGRTVASGTPEEIALRGAIFKVGQHESPRKPNHHGLRGLFRLIVYSVSRFRPSS